MDDQDRRLIEAVARGEESALEQLMQTHLPSVTAVAYRLLKDEAAADDAAQETFLAVWRSAASFRGESSGKSWIMRIALNKARSAWRWRSLRRWLSLDASAGEEPDAPSLGDALPEKGAGSDPAAESERADRSARLRAAVDALPSRQREMILLRLEGLELSEIAAATGAAEGTVKATLHQARAKLEALLKEDA
ncbi:MAG: RNA polymerase sigma factor [Elusimicrobiota bacterium]|nr:RNA polymerase sigma factor [Elusimicrobiota bacterium]